MAYWALQTKSMLLLHDKITDIVVERAQMVPLQEESSETLYYLECFG